MERQNKRTEGSNILPFMDNGGNRRVNTSSSGHRVKMTDEGQDGSILVDVEVLLPTVLRGTSVSLDQVVEVPETHQDDVVLHVTDNPRSVFSEALPSRVLPSNDLPPTETQRYFCPCLGLCTRGTQESRPGHRGVSRALFLTV